MELLLIRRPVGTRAGRAFLAAFLAVFVAAVAVGCGAVQRVGADPSGTFDQDVPVQGSPTAPVTIIEFTDYQCPYCVRSQAVLKKLRKEMGDQLRIVSLNLPLSFHRQARPAAIAAAAAHRQGRFWDMHRALFRDSKRLRERGHIDAIGRELGLDMPRWIRDRADPALHQWIDRQTMIAKALGVKGTPNFFVNGIPVRGAASLLTFRKTARRALAAARAEEASGATGRALLAKVWSRAAPDHGPRLARLIVDGVAVDPRDLVGTRPSRRVRPLWLDEQLWRVPLDPQRQAVLGDLEKAEITMIEFTDLQCPFCRRLNKTLKRLHELHGKRIAHVMRHLPLSFHKLAYPAHIATLAAGRQGKFWAFRQACFEGGVGKLDEKGLLQHATTLGLDIDRWHRDRKDPVLAQQIAQDMRVAAKLGVRGTPTVFLNGQRFSGARPLSWYRDKVAAVFKTSAGKRYDEIVAGGRESGAAWGPSITDLPSLRAWRGSSGTPRSVIVVADLGKVESLVAMYNLMWAWRETKQQLSISVLPWVEPSNPASARAGRLLLAAHRKGGENALSRVIATVLTSPRRKIEDRLVAAGAAVGLAVTDWQPPSPALDDELAVLRRKATAAGVPAAVAIVLNGKLLQPANGYTGKGLRNVFKQR